MANLYIKSFFTVLILSQPLLANIGVVEKLGNNQKKILKEKLNNQIKGQKMASLVVAATRGDQVIYFGGVGKANMATDEDVLPEFHTFRWASVSKVTTELFSRALEEIGVLDLDDPIDKYYSFSTPEVYRRCFDSSNLVKYFDCQKKYGFETPIKNIKGTCFDVDSFGKVKTKKGYKVDVLDLTATKGQIRFATDSGTACTARYSISKETLDLKKYPITLRQLIDHTAGVQHYSYFGNESEPPKSEIGNVQKVKARKESSQSKMEWAIKYFFPKYPLINRPGLARSYSTFGHNLAGVVIEKASAMTYDKLLELYAGKMGAKSLQVDYLGLKPNGNFKNAFVHKLENGKLKNNPYDTDNSYKISGGGIRSTIVDLGKFCAALSKDKYIVNSGFNNYSHNGSHANRSAARLVLRTAKDGQPQCLVIMTNTNHYRISLEAVQTVVQKQLIDFGVWEQF